MAVIGVVGLGNMGRGMALSLKRAGHEVLGTDSSEPVRAALASDGIAVFDAIEPLCARADLLILSLPTAEIVEAVVAGEGGIIAHGKPGLRVVDTSTSHPETTRRLATALAAQGMAMMDAPVSGGPKGAITATMIMVIGGADEDVAAVEPILADMSAKRVHVGSVGAGHACKIINNLLCAAHLLTAAEAMRIAREAKVDPARLFDGINAGSGRSGVTQVNLPTWILNGAFDSGFTMKLMRKDVRLASQLIGELGLDLPIAGEAARIWAASATSISDPEDFNRIVELQLGRM
ncbi:NAD(P)-dependent oxidoreductase [Bradyrhizobium iriomotense]|uniref:3-hydroxyisobutyrate dehydrogenase n=1 Tax=Bradyrhizobium iriomotense TaxID=441950 RepID=A0ABQ6AP45_9BRAD|nr:NAD(P)-dependent oxidoreductase [Bradyrhizobium iriomotense]GLR83690.1 3-hydroxyisobutyrate dehydrogenase [Bradyrhizobium iriomotense]